MTLLIHVLGDKHAHLARSPSYPGPGPVHWGRRRCIWVSVL